RHVHAHVREHVAAQYPPPDPPRRLPLPGAPRAITTHAPRYAPPSTPVHPLPKYRFRRLSGRTTGGSSTTCTTRCRVRPRWAREKNDLFVDRSPGNAPPRPRGAERGKEP